MEPFSQKSLFVFLSLLLIYSAVGRNAIADDTSDFSSVTGPCYLKFPQDHGPHPGYRTEWWYYTGNLQAESGDPYGYQLVFFRSQISPPGARQNWPRPPSAWRTQQIFLGHAAVSDISGNRHLQAELISRGALGMAGASQETAATSVFVNDWSVRIGDGSHRLAAVADDFSIDLSLQSVKPPVLHGQAGYSRKGTSARRASCYYSLTRLISKGYLKISEQAVAVEGLSWMDHEYSTAPLEPGIVGWDWFGLQLSDQTELMFFLLRKENSGIHAASSGTFIDRSGRPQHLTRENFSLEVLERWKSPASGALYPVRWRLNVSPLSVQLTIAANLPDQEMRTTAGPAVIYWEGSVSAHGSVAGHNVTAEGYAELTGYAKPFRGPM